MKIQIGRRKKEGDSFVPWNDSFTTIRLFVSGCFLFSKIQCIEFNNVHHIIGSLKIMQTINLPVEQKCLFNSNKHHDVVLISDCLANKKWANKRTTNSTGDTKMNKTTKVRTQNIVSNFKRFYSLFRILFPYMHLITFSFACCNQPKLPFSYYLFFQWTANKKRC